MDDLILLIALSVAMFVGSYIAGSLPLIVPFSESRLRLITVLGAGLLVGTALAVIIPEGVQSIYSAAGNSESHSVVHRPVVRPPLAVIPGAPIVDSHGLNLNAPPSGQQLAARNSQSILQPNAHLHPQKKDAGVNPEAKDDQSKNAAAANQAQQRQKKELPLPLAGMETRTKRKREAGGGDGADHDHHDHKDPKTAMGESAAGAADVDFPDQQHDNDGGHQHGGGSSSSGGGHSHKADVHGQVGIALVAGFVLMLLVDQLAQQRSGRDVDLGGGPVQPRYKITATIGLVVHAAADGIALGAASSSEHSEIQLIVFLAIMLHKAPASFGLVTFLLHEGLDKTRIRRHLLIFALAAPVAAVLTYFFISHGGNKEQLSSMNTTGILLLFSAGTFLYVATVHVLPEVAAGGHHHGPGGGGHNNKSGFKLNELLALVLGAVAPTFLTLGHSH